ncbi:MAG: MBOAT family protein [Bacteroidales bacterium]|nr:MBOAT family protein [Bacteroidales bacterium]
MLFNSIDFAIFLPIVFILYWFVINRKLKYQNFLLLVASYVFYGWWNPIFLSLIVISSTVDYWVGIQLSKEERTDKRKLLLLTSLLLNLGFLGVFKYFNFFVQSFADAFTLLGNPINTTVLHITLPVGISFYTFQTLSYSIDVYRRKLEPTKDVVAFFSFVSFFPQLVAGPIERASNLLPQFYQNRKFDPVKATDGMRQILWGLFKKVVIADNVATYVTEAFNNYQDYNGFTLFIGAVFFAFQIYCDFSGYSDIAIGTARLFGFTLMRNFAFPYFSRDIAEFWRRWHISLSTWFRDYVYIPLGGSRVSKAKMIRNTFIIFLVSGFWHGANWTFVIWGALNAIYFLPLLLMKQNRRNLDIAAKGKYLPSIREFLQIALTFFLTVIAWVFFRSQTVAEAFIITKKIFTSIYVIDVAELRSLSNSLWVTTSHVALVILLVVAEWLQRDKQHALEFENTRLPRLVRWAYYYFIIFLIFYFTGTQQDFIYFQF